MRQAYDYWQDQPGSYWVVVERSRDRPLESGGGGGAAAAAFTGAARPSKLWARWTGSRLRANQRATYLPTSVQVRFLGNARRPTSPVYDAASRVHSALSLRVCLVFRCSSGGSLVKGNNAAPCVLRSNRPLDRSCVSGQEVKGLSTRGMVDRTESGVTIQKKRRVAALKARRFGLTRSR